MLFFITTTTTSSKSRYHAELVEVVHAGDGVSAQIQVLQAQQLREVLNLADFVERQVQSLELDQVRQSRDGCNLSDNTVEQQ
jgi:hypothetical protein